VATPDLSAADASAGDRPDLRVLADPARVAAVERLLATGPPGTAVQRLTGLAARLLDTPCAQISLLTAQEQVVTAAVGVDWSRQQRSPASDSMCSVTVALGRAFVVEEAAGHPWVYDLPPVTSGQVSSYLGVILTDAAGHVLGSLCVYGDRPRSWADGDCDTMTALAEVVAAELEDSVDAG
jgi:GAF domain-containing protein